jgi:hypothetical protein
MPSVAAPRIPPAPAASALPRTAQRIADRLNHEHWPWWLIYLPVMPLYLYQALRLRRAAFFTNVDPAIDLGGFFGERKSTIYAGLPPGSYPTTLLVQPGEDADAVLHRVHAAGIPFPLIVKPDVGERGTGVTLVKHPEMLRHLLAHATDQLLVQALAEGDQEFGLMFARDPVSGHTALLSITGKDFLTVVGDGTRTVAQLLALTHRGAQQIARLQTYAAELLASVPSPGQELRVEPIGNHCRGTRFVDAGHLRTPALEQAVDHLMAATTGLYYGRLDVRSTSAEALRQGRFHIIELNGVTSEPGHIYDPSITIWRCWAELLRHVRHIGRISRLLLAQGVEPAPLHTVIHRCGTHFGWRVALLRWLCGGTWRG